MASSSCAICAIIKEFDAKFDAECVCRNAYVPIDPKIVESYGVCVAGVLQKVAAAGRAGERVFTDNGTLHNNVMRLFHEFCSCVEGTQVPIISAQIVMPYVSILKSLIAQAYTAKETIATLQEYASQIEIIVKTINCIAFYPITVQFRTILLLEGNAVSIGEYDKFMAKLFTTDHSWVRKDCADDIAEVCDAVEKKQP
jgi:hypothetical protein